MHMAVLSPVLSFSIFAQWMFFKKQPLTRSLPRFTLYRNGDTHTLLMKLCSIPLCSKIMIWFVKRTCYKNGCVFQTGAPPPAVETATTLRVSGPNTFLTVILGRQVWFWAELEKEIQYDSGREYTWGNWLHLQLSLAL